MTQKYNRSFVRGARARARVCVTNVRTSISLSRLAYALIFDRSPSER